MFRDWNEMFLRYGDANVAAFDRKMGISSFYAKALGRSLDLSVSDWKRVCVSEKDRESMSR